MEVKLLRYTQNPEDVCAEAMMGCQSTKAAFEIPPSGEMVQKMIRMAIESGHESVLEHASFTFSVKGISRACTHQLVRHRIASYSQQSQRHVNPTKASESSRTQEDDWFVTPPSIARYYLQKGGDYDDFMNKIAGFYQTLVDLGIPKEDARFVLPNACKTNIVITMNTRELRHFFKLRRAKEAQWEIREMANRMYELVRPLAQNMFEGEGELEV
jgi:thymidylate synthase (FAD)